jgi:Glycosyl transferase family 2.
MVKYDYKSFYNKLAMKKINLNQVTVVIPTYNSEKTIEGTLNSIYKYFNTNYNSRCRF